MSQKNSLVATPSAELLVRKIKSAEVSNQKVVVLTLTEARELVNELAILSGRATAALETILSAINEIKSSSPEVHEVKFDGGGFEER